MTTIKIPVVNWSQRSKEALAETLRQMKVPYSLTTPVGEYPGSDGQFYFAVTNPTSQDFTRVVQFLDLAHIHYDTDSQLPQKNKSRVDIIDEVLIYHHNVKKDGGGLICLCGHPMELGRSIYQHQAEVIDKALTYSETGAM